MTNGVPLVLPTATQTRPPAFGANARRNLFREAFMTALGGFCSQFEVGLPYHKPQNATGTAELVRSRQICLRAWNVAAFTVGLFSQDAEIEEFNSNINTTGE